MMGKKRVIEETVGFLGRLRRDVRGNTLALMAALLIPLAALSGSAVDLARVYAVKTRLQQACDAGALAGRKMMTGSDVLDASDTGPAQTFFKNNFNQGWFKTNQVSFTVAKTSDGQVSGAATATVPMTVMTMFGMGARTVNVTCEARFDVADADIMFVLDTTGSMACTTSDDPCGDLCPSRLDNGLLYGRGRRFQDFRTALGGDELLRHAHQDRRSDHAHTIRIRDLHIDGQCRLSAQVGLSGEERELLDAVV
jgi:Flp pilus assembly protein TadG